MTGYVVHYSDGDTDRNESVPVSSTSSLITGLTINITYNFSVEATSKHLSGESDILTIITLGKFMFEESVVCVNLLYGSQEIYKIKLPHTWDRVYSASNTLKHP